MLPPAADRCAGLFRGQGARYVGRMRITCPACIAAYDVPDARIVPGQGVRCARCCADWVPVQAGPAPPDVLDDPRPEPVREPSLSQAPAPAGQVLLPGRPPVVLAGWVLSLVLLGCLAWAAYAWRADVMRQWPPSQRLYAAFGLTGPALPQ